MEWSRNGRLLHSQGGDEEEEEEEEEAGAPGKTRA